MRAHAAAILAFVALLVSGCASSTTVTVPPTSAAAIPAPSPTPAANEYVDSVVHTRGLGTASAEISLTRSIGTRASALSAVGGVDLARGYGDLTWRAADGTVVRERSNGKGLFVQSTVPSGTWEKRVSMDESGTARVADVLRGLGTLESLRLDGSEVVQGTSIHRYAGHSPVTDTTLGQLGITGSDATVIADEAAAARVDVTVWIDPVGRVVRVDRALDLADTSRGPVRAATSTRLSDFSGVLDLSPPPSESVTSASAT